jgi:hypothetical protein
MTLSSTCAAVTLLLAVAAGAVAAQQKPQYVAGMLSTVPSGYALASLADLQSTDFLTQYNSFGINYVQSFASGIICCVVNVAEGYLSIGPSNAYSNYLQPFINGADVCSSNTIPQSTTFGVPSFSPGPYEGMWISNLTTKEQAGFRVTGITPAGGNFGECGVSSSSTTAIFKALPPKYVIRPFGPNYPAPNASEYTIASLADVKSADFQAAYNATGGILLAGSASTNYCCLIRVSNDAWLYYGANSTSFSPLSLFNEGTSQWACSDATNNDMHFLGTSFGGPTPGLVFNTLNAATTSQFGSFWNNTQNWDGCGSNLPDSLTVFKRVTLPKYIIQPYGPNFPLPSGYAVATFADVLSQDFQDSYNTAGGVFMPAVSTTNNFCCIVQVAGGNILNYNVDPTPSPLSTYAEPGSLHEIECSETSASQWVFLGTAFGANTQTVFGTINSTVTSLLTTFNSTSSSWCMGIPNAKTLLKLMD